MEIKLLGLSGSLRSGSFNTKLMLAAAKSFGPADFVAGNLRLPLYDGDLEAGDGIPDDVKTLAEQIADADAIVVANPEYNKGISGVLKNALDWVSRVPGSPFQGKPVVIIGAAAGRTGGETSYYMTRHCLSALNADVMAVPPVLIAGAHNEFSDTGTLVNDRYQSALDVAMSGLRNAVDY